MHINQIHLRLLSVLLLTSALEALSFTSEQVWGVKTTPSGEPACDKEKSPAGSGDGGSGDGGAGSSAGSGAGGSGDGNNGSSAGSGAGGSGDGKTGSSAGGGAGGSGDGKIGSSAGSGAGGSGDGEASGSNPKGSKGDKPTGASGKGKKKGNPNLGRKPNSLWEYSTNLAFDINAFNLTEEDLFDLYVPEDLQEKFQKAKEEAVAKAEERGLYGKARLDFYIYYLTKRFDIFPTVNYFPGFYYTTLNVSPIAKGNDTTINARHTNRLFRTSAATPTVIAHFLKS